MTLDEHRRKDQLRSWTKWKDRTPDRIFFVPPIKPEDRVRLDVRTLIDPETGDETWEYVEVD